MSHSTPPSDAHSNISIAAEAGKEVMDRLADIKDSTSKVKENEKNMDAASNANNSSSSSGSSGSGYNSGNYNSGNYGG